MNKFLAFSLMMAALPGINERRGSGVIITDDVPIKGGSKPCRGMIQFFYGENSLWAINQTNADKKAKKKGWL